MVTSRLEYSAWGFGSVVKLLPSMYQALGSVPSTKRKKCSSFILGKDYLQARLCAYGLERLRQLEEGPTSDQVACFLGCSWKKLFSLGCFTSYQKWHWENALPNVPCSSHCTRLSKLWMQWYRDEFFHILLSLPRICPSLDTDKTRSLLPNEKSFQM